MSLLCKAHRRWRACAIIGYCLAFAVVFVFVLYWLIANCRWQPEYDGRALNAWLRDLHEAESSEAQNAAKKAVQAMGTNVGPILLKMLAHEDPACGQWLDWVARKQTLIRIPVTSQDRKRAYAACGFEALGSQAESFIPEVDQLATRSSNYWAGVALGGLWPVAMPQIRHALSNENDKVRSAVLDGIIYLATSDCFQTFGEHTEHAIYTTNAEALVADIHRHAKSDPSLWVRYRATEALARVGEDKKVVPLLAEILGDPAELVRSGAVKGLGHLVKQSPLARDAVRFAANDESPNVRKIAREMIAKAQEPSQTTTTTPTR